MNLSNVISSVEAHAAGCPLRVITGGFPMIPGQVGGGEDSVPAGRDGPSSDGGAVRAPGTQRDVRDGDNGSVDAGG